MYYVTMTDKFMSGWGLAQNKINKLILECETYQQAQIVADNAQNRSEMKNVNITTKKPYYPSKKYYAQTETIDTYSRWYEKGAFQLDDFREAD